MLAAERVSRLEESLAKARETISPHYDDVFHEVQQRISAVGSVGKGDIAVLSFWKRLRADTRWVRTLLGLPDSDVRAVTGRAVAVARAGDASVAAGQAREILRSLPGFATGTALASALLTAASPDRLAVYDRRAHRGLGRVELELAEEPPLFYARYMRLIESCREEAAGAGHQWSVRDVDLALLIMGGK